jgi:pimeloyl-ACP methyl ester carboxylesterase
MPILADTYYHLFEGSQEGQKPAVVLIHGAGGNHLYWPSNVRRLPGYRVYAIDLPGHGKSEGRGQQTIAAYVEAVLRWMGTLTLHSAVFVGHSMGSAIAMSLALDHPEHVLGLGLVGAGARLRVADLLLDSASSSTTFHNAVDMLVSWSFASQAPEQLVTLAARRMAETRYSVLHGDFLACDAFDVTDRLDEVRCPTLVLCGAEDKMTPKRDSQYLADRIPGATLEIIPDAGHMVMLEQPASVGASLLGFLDNIHY